MTIVSADAAANKGAVKFSYSQDGEEIFTIEIGVFDFADNVNKDSFIEFKCKARDTSTQPLNPFPIQYCGECVQ